MRKISLKLLTALLAGLLVLVPSTAAWAQTEEEPVEEVVEAEPELDLSSEEEAADYSGEPEEAWEEGDAQ